MPRPGFVLDVDRSTPPILFHHGEGFRLEKLPAGRTRIIYPGEPLDPLDDPDGAIRDALLDPLDDDPPLRALLLAGHEAHDLLRRRLAAAAADAAPRHPPAGDRGGARPGRRGRASTTSTSSPPSPCTGA